jgi:FAD/FMN-containing dehydrogenase
MGAADPRKLLVLSFPLMPTRREFLIASGLTAAWPHGGAFARSRGVVVNDVHSQLTATRVNRIVAPSSLDAVREALAAARKERRAVSLSGGRHAMGAQAFATDGVMLDTRKLNRVLRFDAERGVIESSLPQYSALPPI